MTFDPDDNAPQPPKRAWWRSIRFRRPALGGLGLGRWRWIVVVLVGLFVLYYPLGAMIAENIDDDPQFKAAGVVAGESRAVAIASDLVTREVDCGPPIAVSYGLTESGRALLPAMRELIRGTVEVRVLRHERDGKATCSKLVYFQNDKAKSDAAIAASDKTALDPAVIKAMQDDLRDQYLKHVPVVHPVAPTPP